MASKIKLLREEAEKRGDQIGPLLPANWIKISGSFTPSELNVIKVAVEDNFARANGNTK
jgi:hypothetical protein